MLCVGIPWWIAMAAPGEVGAPRAGPAAGGCGCGWPGQLSGFQGELLGWSWMHSTWDHIYII